MTAHERLVAKVELSGDCWLWTGAISAKGYALMKVDGRCQRAHRVAYETFVGPIPEGLQLDHLCRVRHCVNPDHLEPVTARENVMRGDGWKSWFLSPSHCIHGHELTDDNVSVRPDGRRRCKACRRRESQKRPRPDVGTSRPSPEHLSAIATKGRSVTGPRKGPC